MREFKIEPEPVEKKPEGMEGVRREAKKGLKGIPSEEQHEILEMLKCLVKHQTDKRALFPPSTPTHSTTNQGAISDNVYESNLTALERVLETPEEEKREAVLQLMKTLQM